MDIRNIFLQDDKCKCPNVMLISTAGMGSIVIVCIYTNLDSLGRSEHHELYKTVRASQNVNSSLIKM